jgi:hypothetical protein
MCQLQHIDEIGRQNTWLDDKRQWLIRKFRWYRKKTVMRLRPNKYGAIVPPGSTLEFRPGDSVRVLPAGEINRRINRSRKTQGCTFQVGMYEHCGKEFEVLKKVEYFFDEARQKMCKCNNIYLLEGSFCNGKTAYMKRCDRNCYYFWHANWLEKA